jgi:hypothetical protein
MIVHFVRMLAISSYAQNRKSFGSRSNLKNLMVLLPAVREGKRLVIPASKVHTLKLLLFIHSS